MIKNKDIIDEFNPKIRKKSKDITFPLDEKYKKVINDSLEMLKLSQIEEKAQELNLRPGMGLSAVQLGILKRFFVIVYEYEKGKFENYVVINPKILSESSEMIYVDGGEGCLSVNREVEGIVPRHARINVEFYDMNGVKHNMRFREELSVVFQHEYDHLDGILFIDRINKDNPFDKEEKMRAI